ncbi:hypothetical protein Pint_33591 [Pistacia integerrima]|uniref:Uncharacterized protein n=1 Tax=Pistacia integerrima TaxID=434235 RepID=A0ACC0X4R4_9ROSI|nr:hypothetical protein Pint_33591 [Pistacia integerrima]
MLTFLAKPITVSNSFVGTEEYITPEIIIGAGHSIAINWWALGIFLYEMLYGRTPFRGKNRQKTFANILHKDLTFPSSIPTKICRLLSRLKLFSCYSGESVDIVYMLRILRFGQNMDNLLNLN